jgi:hypothetical protein
MGKNGRYLYSRRLGGRQFLGGIFGREKILFLLTEIGRILGVPCRRLVAISIRIIYFSYNDSLYNKMLN